MPRTLAEGTSEQAFVYEPTSYLFYIGSKYLDSEEMRNKPHGQCAWT